MNRVRTGLDGLNATFSDGTIGLETVAGMFEGVTEDMFTFSKSTLKWYESCYSLKCNNTTLVQFHVLSRSFYGNGRHHLLSVNGLCFSDSALNPFRPLNLTRLIRQILHHGGKVSKFDVYLDDYTAAIPQERLNEMSQPHTFDQYIQSPFLKARDGEKPEPRYFKGTWYYGQPKRNACEITTYNKGLSPRQKIHSRANPIKFTWQRYELRFTGDTAKRLGKELLSDLELGKNLNSCITQLFRRYLRFVEPSDKNKRPSTWELQPWWVNLLSLADQQPPVTLLCSPVFE